MANGRDGKQQVRKWIHLRIVGGWGKRVHKQGFTKCKLKSQHFLYFLKFSYESFKDDFKSKKKDWEPLIAAYGQSKENLGDISQPQVNHWDGKFLINSIFHMPIQVLMEKQLNQQMKIVSIGLFDLND